MAPAKAAKASEYHAKLIAEKFTGLKVAGGDYQDIAAEPLPYPSIRSCIWRFDEPLHGKPRSFATAESNVQGAPHARKTTHAPNNPRSKT